MDLDLAQLDALSRAVSEGTFDAAARALGVTPSAISQRIKALERACGRVLLSREKPVRPTPAGEALLRIAVQMRALADEAAHELDDTGASSLSLAVNADSLATWVLPALATVTRPVVFDLHRDDQEHTVDLLRRGTVMAAITASADPVPGCTVRRLGGMRYRPVATPEFLRRWMSDGPSTSGLHRAPMVVFDRADRLQDRYLQRRTRGRADPPRHHVPASADFHEAIRLGLGWGMVPDQQAGGDLHDGALVDFDPAGHAIVRLHWQQWRIHGPLLAEVADAILRAAQATLIQAGRVSAASPPSA